MGKITVVHVVPGVVWVEIPDADLRILCGCPADSVKHLMRRGLIRPVEVRGIPCESGPNVILLSDVMVQNGAFCNLAEFPVLQMLYRQGMILPDHPNNDGRKPLLIGRREILESQLQYIHRGNYGLISEEEMIAAGAGPDLARAMMRLKLRFAFGRIQDPLELLNGQLLGDDDGATVTLAGGVVVRRRALNVFEFHHDGASAVADLNLPPFESYECPYPLGAFQFTREYFAVVHSGEGDGWDIRRPSMGAVLVYQGRVFLIDAGPNLPYALTALGIGINEIEGIFQTHSHDDHFAGLTTLIQADHRIKYRATPLVRAAVQKKLAALMGSEERDFAEYFDVRDLTSGQWNDMDGLDIQPVFSPHPVETTIFFFRTLASGGWRSYAHLADIVGFRTLDSMVTDDPERPGLDRAWAERIKAAYLEPADVKKVDIGGGLIHGDATDFRHDRSRKIILAHTALKFTDEQKHIGSGASFGTVDVLVPSHRDFIWRSAFTILRNYFPSVTTEHLGVLMNNPIRTFTPETILLKEKQSHDSMFLVLTGQVEMLDSESPFRTTLSAGALVGEMTGLYGLPSLETYRAVSFVQALHISCELYLSFVKRHDVFPHISQLMEGREFLRKSWLCGGVMSTGVLNEVAQQMTERTLAAGDEIAVRHEVGMVKSGRVERRVAGCAVETLGPGEFFGEETAVFQVAPYGTMVVAEPSHVLFMPASRLESIPNIRWKLFESFGRRTRAQEARQAGREHANR